MSPPISTELGLARNFVEALIASAPPSNLISQTKGILLTSSAQS